MTRVKICGCRKAADASWAADAGADYAGVVFAERLRRVTPGEAAEVLAPVRGVLQTVGVFVDPLLSDVLGTRDVAGIEIVQLHGDEPPELCDALREDGVGVWKALRPRSEAELAASVERYREHVDGMLIEGYSAAAAGGTGTGFPHDWVAPLRHRFASAETPGAQARTAPAPGLALPALVLAGGLRPDNVSGAIEAARPGVVDVSSGVERAPGEKDRGMIRAFVAAVRVAHRASASGA